MADITISYKDSTIAEINESGSKKILTKGKYCEDDISIDYVKSGGGDGGTELEDAFLMRNISGDYSNHRVTKISSYLFALCDELTSIDFPNVETIGANAFQACVQLKSLNFPKCHTLEGNVFASCNQVESANFPVLTTCASSFNSCTRLKSFYAPMLQTIGNQAFYCDSAIITLDLPSLTSIGTHAFNSCTRMTALILRSETVCTLANINGFTNNPIAKGTGYIYVPSALVESYKTATNWSTYASQFRALEDYTVDGTVTGELDESKI